MGLLDKFRDWRQERVERGMERDVRRTGELEREAQALDVERRVYTASARSGRRMEGAWGELFGGEVSYGREESYRGAYKDFLEDFEDAIDDVDKGKVVDRYIRKMMQKGWKQKDAKDRLLQVLLRYGIRVEEG